MKPELLAPAGSLDILKIAFKYGADAVYCGTSAFAMRARVGFTIGELGEGIKYAHSIGKKVYLTLNTFPHSLEIEAILDHARKLAALKPDAFIIADPGILQFAKENFDIPIHLSTQANVTNHLAADFWKNQGVERVVLARELSLSEIKTISENSSVELEAFIHGAMCMAYSGRCQISNYMTGRDPNRGQCVQACRFKYKIYGLEEDLRKNEFFPIYEDESGTHILNSKDLCMIDHIPELIESGIKSFKIEGRLKSEYYVALVVRAYRKAIDLALSGTNKYESAKKELFAEITKTANRGLTTGFYFDKPNQDTNNYASSKAVSTWGYIGRVVSYDKKTKRVSFECKNHLPIDAEIEILSPTETFVRKITEMYIKNEPTEVAHANSLVEIPFESNIEPDSLIRIKLKE